MRKRINLSSLEFLIIGTVLSFTVPFAANTAINLSDKMFESQENFIEIDLEEDQKESVVNSKKVKSFNNEAPDKVKSGKEFTVKIKDPSEYNFEEIRDNLNQKIESVDERTEKLRALADMMLNKSKDIEKIAKEAQSSGSSINENKVIRSEFRESLKEALNSKTATDYITQGKESKSEPIRVVKEPQVAQEQSSKNVTSGEEKEVVKPKLGFDGYGKPLGKEGTRLQIKMIADKLPKDFTVNFPANGEEVGELFVFSDPTCPFCKKLHKDIPRLNNAGFTVRYLYFPKLGLENNPVVDRMRASWCSSDQAKSVDTMFDGRLKSENDCSLLSESQQKYDDIVLQHYMMAMFFNVAGTPTVFASNGGLAAGYSNPVKLLQALGYTVK